MSCGCTSTTVAANTLRPGESTYLTASMDTKKFVGPKEVIIFVNFANPYEEVTLSVRANRNDNFSKSAESLHLGQVRKGADATRGHPGDDAKRSELRDPGGGQRDRVRQAGRPARSAGTGARSCMKSRPP